MLGVLYPWVFPTGGLIYLFAKKSLQPNFRLRAGHLGHLLPMGWGIYRVWPLFEMPLEKKQAVIEWFLKPDEIFPVRFLIEGNIHILVLAAYAVATWQMARKVEQAQVLPDNRQKSKWMQQFAKFFLLLLCFDIAVKLTFFFLKIPASTVEYLLAAAFALTVHLLGYHAIGSLDNLPKIQPNGKYITSPLSTGQLEQGKQALLDLMQREKPYLNPELKISNLAIALKMPSHHLSQILNEHLGTGFYEFVNTYRVRAAQEMLRNDRFAHYSIVAVGMDCGFANKTSFNRVFKKMTSQTPSEYAGKRRG